MALQLDLAHQGIVCGLQQVPQPHAAQAHGTAWAMGVGLDAGGWTR